MGGEGLLFGVLAEPLVVFVPFGLLGAVVRIGAPVGVVLSLVIR